MVSDDKLGGENRNVKWLSVIQVSDILKVSVSKLRSDRHLCRGIPYSKIGR